jgi:cytochrome P450
MLFHSRIKQFEGIPGPTPVFPLGTLLEFRAKNPWDVCAEYEKIYGGVTLIWEFAKPILVLNEPELIREVLITKAQDYWKDDPTEAFRPVLRETEFDENGEKWRQLRQGEPMCVEGFDQWLPSQVPAVRNVVNEHLKRLTSAGSVNLLPAMERMVYDVYNACCVGRQLSDSDYDAFYTTSNMATRRMKLPKWLLFHPIRPAFWSAMKQHFGVFGKIVADARRDLNSSANDLLHVYLRKAPKVSDEQLAMYLGNIHAGGVFSAGTALVNTIFLVHRHAEVAQKLHQQLKVQLQQKPDFTATDLEQCPLLDQSLRESMRYYAPVPLFFRNVLKTRSTQLGKYTLPPNTVVFLVAQGVHRSSRFWKEPDRFDPSRWESNAMPANAFDSDIYFPFGRGERLCVGASLAMFCMKVMLASIWSRVRVEIDPHVGYRQFFHCGVAQPLNITGRFVPNG